MKYLVFNNSTGKVLRTGYCPDDEHAMMQSLSGETSVVNPDEGITADGRWTRASNGVYSQDAIPSPTIPTLQAYADSAATALAGAATTYTYNTTSIKSDCAQGTIADWMALQQWSSLSPTATKTWVANDYTLQALPASAVGAIATMIATRRAAIFAVLAAVLIAIENFTITTTAQIDSVSWPT
jgi:hypothetical protein